MTKTPTPRFPLTLRLRAAWLRGIIDACTHTGHWPSWVDRRGCENWSRKVTVIASGDDKVSRMDRILISLFISATAAALERHIQERQAARG